MRRCACLWRCNGGALVVGAGSGSSTRLSATPAWLETIPSQIIRSPMGFKSTSQSFDTGKTPRRPAEIHFTWLENRATMTTPDQTLAARWLAKMRILAW